MLIGIEVLVVTNYEYFERTFLNELFVLFRWHIILEYDIKMADLKYTY